MTPETAAKLYSSFCKMGEDGVLELYCDNHMLSAFRKCQGYFQEQFLAEPGKMLLPMGRAWSLEFGQYFHKCLEYFYQAQRENWEGEFLVNCPTIESPDGLKNVKQDIISFLQICSDLWKSFDLEYFMDKELVKGPGKNAQALGGHDGAIRLYIQYYKVYARKERFRFVGWELSFGHNKEVPIITENYETSIPRRPYDGFDFRAYYCGRLDLVVDNSEVIGPVDHKTTAYFDGHEGENFKPHDGMQGYVHSVQQMLKDKFQSTGRLCNTMIINHVSIRATEDMAARFKRSYKSYTLGEMDAWLKRQQATFLGIYDVLINERPVTWDTDLCNMWYYSHPCPYKQLHELPQVAREGIVKINYQLKDAWSPYSV